MSLRSWSARQWGWLQGYNARIFTLDFVAAFIVTVLLVPQALAYAMLAGLPPRVGIYASIFPLLAYAVFGSSRFLSVGPTAVISLMTAVAIAELPEGSRLVGAAMLAILSGLMLVALSIVRGGLIMNFVSRSVVSAYITGAAILIISSQLKHILGVTASGTTVYQLIASEFAALDSLNIYALIIGIIAIIYLLMVRNALPLFLVRRGVKARRAKLISRIAPIIIIIASIVIVALSGLANTKGLRVVGDIPTGLPPFEIPSTRIADYRALVVPALIIALVAFVDSMSTAQTLASRARTRVDANRELLGLGVSNVVSGLSGGYPINGSMSRSAVNFDAGAQTPIASLLTAAFMLLTALFLTPLLTYLPLAVLAALIIVACFSLLQFRMLWRVAIYSPTDGMTALATFLAVLFLGVQWGVVVGVIMSMAFHIRTTLRPNMAIVGRFPGTEHYRDAEKFNVETWDEVKTLRIDESLYYANARYLEDKIARLVQENPKMTDLILMCPAVNRVDASALASLETINQRLHSADVALHFSELKTHIYDRFQRTRFLDSLTGQVYLSQQQAMEALEPDPDWSQFSDHVEIH